MTERVRVALALVMAVAAGVGRAEGQDCPGVAASLVEDGWRAYRSGAVTRADTLFRRALARCPGDLAAETGVGYTALRLGRTGEAEERFQRVLAANAAIVDALVGLGLVSWVQGNQDSARARFQRVLEVEASQVTALEYLARLPEEPPPPPARPPLVRPDTLVHRFRARGDRFEILTPEGWRPFYVKGVNLGAALPGRFPSQFPDSATYAGWLEAMGEMGLNTVRLYTIHPPHFYRALRDYNLHHPERPLYLIHGVWTELPPENDYDAPVWKGEFFGEMRRVVDLVHGRADLPPRPGHASGAYTADVSDWVFAYVIGREWEPFSVREYNLLRAGRTAWAGWFIRLEGGTPTEAWLAEACERIVAYETETYGHQRPVAYTNWPTLDPLRHPTETTVEEEIALREALGETVEGEIREYDNDAVSLDATLMRATARFPAGVFAVFHAYPYYPDFMILDPEYGQARSSEGPSNYFGYLRDLKAHHAGMPVLIGEYGVPASLGSAHLQPQGWHHGGHTEDRMAEIDARLTREIAEAGMAGGVVFAWIDEWFKKNWLTLPFEIPAERGRLWWNRLDAEQHYGMVASEPEPAVAGPTLADRREGWRAIPALYTAPNGGALRVAADASALWVLVDPGRGRYEEIYVGLDMVDPRAGEFRWPERVGPQLPVGVEFVLRVTRNEARVLAHPPVNPFRIEAVRENLPHGPDVVPRIAGGALRGLFTGRVEQRFNRPYTPEPSYAGGAEPLRVVTNRPRFARDGTEYAGIGYDRGVLPRGEPPDGFWERLEGTGLVEVRIPWALINVTDPTARRVLYDPPGGGRGFGTVVVDSVGVVAAARDARGWWRYWPAPAHAGLVARAGWALGESSAWRARRRPVFEVLRRTFRELRPAVLEVP